MNEKAVSVSDERLREICEGARFMLVLDENRHCRELHSIAHELLAWRRCVRRGGVRADGAPGDDTPERSIYD